VSLSEKFVHRRESHNTVRLASKNEAKSEGSAWEYPSILGKLGEAAERFPLYDGLTLNIEVGIERAVMRKIALKKFLALALMGGSLSMLNAATPQEVSPESTPAMPWTEILKEGTQELNPATLPSVSEAQSQLAAAMRRLEAFLIPEQSPNGAKWMKFLRWDELKAVVANPDATASDYSAIETRFRQNYVGLETKPFTDVRDALAGMAQALRFGKNSEQTMTLLARRLEELDQHLQEHSITEEELERSRDTGLLLSYLWDSRQAPKLRSIIRREYSQPNMQIVVKEALANKAIRRPVLQTNPVSEVILGTNMTGCATVDGQVECCFVPNSQNAQLQLVMTGRVSSDNVGYNRGVRIDSRGYANVQVSRALTLVPSFSEGLSISAGPVCIDSDFCSVIDSISHRSNLVRNIANKKAAKSKSQADSIAEGRLQKRVTDQFRQQTDEQLSQGNGNTMVMLDRLALERPAANGFTTDDELHLYVNHGRPYQLSAPSACPIPVPDGDLVVRMHQSVVMNYGDSILGGRIIRSEELPDLAKQILGKVPEEMLNQEEERPWSITLANFHPVEMDLRNNQIEITVRLTRMERGDQALDQPLTVTAVYAPNAVEGRTELVRQGEVRIDLIGRQARGTRAVTLQAFLKGKFDKLFREKLMDKPANEADAPAMMSDLKKRFPNLPNLQLSELKTEQGWLQAVMR
jgi:hypothetical protein